MEHLPHHGVPVVFHAKLLFCNKFSGLEHWNTYKCKKQKSRA